AIVEVPKIDGFRVPYVINSDHQRMNIRESFLATENEESEYQANGCEHQNRNFQVSVHHERIAVLLQVAFSRTRDSRCGRFLGAESLRMCLRIHESVSWRSK